MATKSILKKGQAEQGAEICVEPAVNPCDLPLAVPCQDGGYLAGLDDELAAHPGYGPGFDAEADEIELAKSDAELVLDAAKHEAASILAAAMQESETIVTQANLEAGKIRAAAEREIAARRESLARDVTAAVQRDYAGRYSAAVSTLEAAALELQQRQQEYLAGLEKPAYHLVLEIARRLIGAEPRRDPGFIAALIAKAFALLNPGEVARVHVHPLTFQRLADDEALNHALTDAGIRLAHVELELDPTLRPEQFSLQVGGVSIDYNLAASLDEMIEHLERRALGFDGDETAPGPSGQ